MEELLAIAARELGRPKTGEFAFKLWQLLSKDFPFPVRQSKQIYEACGYEPFRGYPLTRKKDF
jgi:hypothetical protein